jgi:hypothetical protein
VHIENAKTTIENLEGDGLDLRLGGNGMYLEKSGSVVAKR